MLKRVHIQNFRSCKDVLLEDMGAITALIGRNAAGKTNVLKAIEWLARVADGTSRGLSYHGFSVIRETIVVSAEVALKKTYFYKIQHSIQVDDNKKNVIPHIQEELFVQERGGSKEMELKRSGNKVEGPHLSPDMTIGDGVSCLPAIVSLLSSTHQVVKLVRPLLRFFGHVRYYPLDEPADPSRNAPELIGFIREEAYKKWLAEYKETGNPGSSVTMRLLHLFLSDLERFNKVKHILDAQLGLLDDIEVAQYPSNESKSRLAGQNDPVFYLLTFVPSQCEGEDRAFDYSQLSVGTRRIVRIVVSLVFDESDAMLIEHPEDGIHTWLVEKVAALLRSESSPTQVIMSSHSSTVLNSLKPEEIRLVAMEKGVTTVAPLSEKERKAAVNYLAKQGPLASFLELVQNE